MAQLDYETQLDLPNPHRTTGRTLLACAAVGLAWGLAAAVYAGVQKPSQPRGAVALFLFGGLFAGLIALALPVGYLVVRGEARRVELFRKNFLAGRYLVKLRYGPETWAPFAAALRADEHARWRTFRNVTVAFGVAALVGVVACVALRHKGDPTGMTVLTGLAVVMFVACAVIYGVGASNRGRRDALLATPQPSLVTTIGAFANGKWILWGTSQRKLEDVKVTGGRTAADPLAIELTIRVGQYNQYERILVPPGKRELAEQIAHAIRTAPEAKTGGELEGILDGANSLLRGLS